MRITDISLRRDPDTGMCTVAVRTEEHPQRWIVVIKDRQAWIQHTVSVSRSLTWRERFQLWLFGTL